MESEIFRSVEDELQRERGTKDNHLSFRRSETERSQSPAFDKEESELFRPVEEKFQREVVHAGGG